MSLIGALRLGQSALAATQAAIQTTGNNITNAGDPNYTREVANVTPSPSQQIAPGVFLGSGVDLTSVQRQIDESLQNRLRGATSDDEAASTTESWLSQIESTFNELSDQDLSTQMSTFFNSWSDLANKLQDLGLRQVVVQNGQDLAQSVQSVRGQLGDLQANAFQQAQSLTTNANSLAQQIADINGQIVQAQGGTAGEDNGLLDQRDALLQQLSQLVNIKTVPQSDGSTNVYVGSDPLIIGTENRGVGVKQQTVNGTLESEIIFKANNGTMEVTSGQLAALNGVAESITGVINQIDTLSHNLIFELNKVYSSGQGLNGLSNATATNAATNPAVALNDPTSGFKYTPTSGSFVVHVTDKNTGLSTSTLVQVDLDGQNGNDTTLNSLASSIDAISNISASVSGGKLSISADSANVDFSFSQDSSGTLAALGINSFFSGTDGGNIAVNSNVAADPSMLAAAKNGDAGDNQTAIAIAAMQNAPIAALNGSSLNDTYQAMINSVSNSAASAKTNADAADTVKQTLTSQREALSGVSLDEEAVNLIQQQRAYQGAARFVSTIDQMMQTLLAIT
ncbi:MAG TPA: flagellar hook-associated protein FlgK [Tepidisphaeraceae bacterium]|nr:flagellar hook-associated protein FlgK [Tepidisphaeraceae bacterium]